MRPPPSSQFIAGHPDAHGDPAEIPKLAGELASVNRDDLTNLRGYRGLHRAVFADDSPAAKNDLRIVHGREGSVVKHPELHDADNPVFFIRERNEAGIQHRRLNRKELGSAVIRPETLRGVDPVNVHRFRVVANDLRQNGKVQVCQKWPKLSCSYYILFSIF